jgi:hypothetical protein
MRGVGAPLAWISLLACPWLAAQPQSWQAPPADVRAAEAKLVPALRQAMESGDEDGVRSVVAQIRQTLGKWAGHTEVETKYHKPVNAAPPPPLSEIRAGWNALFESTESLYKGHGQWVHAGPAPLRETGDVVLGYIDAVKAGASNRELLLQRIREGLDYLLSVQAPNGVFPFPDVRGKDPFFGPMIEREVVKNPDILWHGWMIKDEGDGGLQFDNGVCGYAMLEGYGLLHDGKYRDAARRAADWAAAHEPVANFNYNSFSVWLLAGMYRESGERKYLDAAVRKARIGVLPGEMENGRWVDPHNARPAYHWIMVRALLGLHAALPVGDAFEPVLRKDLVSAIDNGTREILDNGAPSFETPLAVLPAACAMPGAKPEWLTALNVLINGVFDAAQNDPKRIRGISPYGYASYLLFRTEQK